MRRPSPKKHASHHYYKEDLSGRGTKISSRGLQRLEELVEAGGDSVPRRLGGGWRFRRKAGKAGGGRSGVIPNNKTETEKSVFRILYQNHSGYLFNLSVTQLLSGRGSAGRILGKVHSNLAGYTF